MASKSIQSLSKNGEEFFPQTSSDAVLCGTGEDTDLKTVIEQLVQRIDELEKKTQGLDSTGNFIDKVSAPGGFFMK